jgi:hypothetical protein
MQCAVVIGIIYCLLGLIFAVLWLPFAQTMSRMPGATPAAWAMMGAMALVLFPLIYGAIGYIGGLIAAALYNLIAGWTGGVELTLESTGVTGEAMENAVV